MSKLKLLSMVSIGFLTISLAYSQSFNYFGSNATNSPKQNKTQPSVLSPAQFQSAVKDLDKKTQDDLRSQVKNSLSAPPLSNNPSMQVSVPAHTTKQEESQPSSATEQNPPATNYSVSPPPASTPPTNTQPTNAATPPPAQPQSQPYTGFGSGSTTNNTGGAAPGGGWNIKY